MARLSLNDLWYRYLVSALPSAVGNGTEEPTPGTIGGGGSGGGGNTFEESISVIFEDVIGTANSLVATTASLEAGLYMTNVYISFGGNLDTSETFNVSVNMNSTLKSRCLILGESVQTSYIRVVENGTINLKIVATPVDPTLYFFGYLQVTRIGD